MMQIMVTVLIWASIGFFVTIPTMKIFHLWMIDRTWGTGTALTVLVSLFSLLGIIWTMSGPLGALGYSLLLIVGMVLLPVIEQRKDKTLLKEMRDTDMNRYKRLLERDPDNAAAHAMLADTYIELGLYDDAVTGYENAIALERNLSECEHYKYKLKHARAQRDGTTRKPIIICEHCQRENPVDVRLCRKCGNELRIGFVSWLTNPKNLKIVLKQSAVAIAVVILLGLVLSPFSVEVKGCVFIATLMVMAFLFLKRIGE